jgi:hypothetical protein
MNVSTIPTIPYDQVGPFGPGNHEHVQTVLVIHVHLVFGDLAILDTVVNNPCLEQSSGSGITHNNKI